MMGVIIEMSSSIIVAEDEPITRMDICEMLTSAGYYVAGEASNGLQVVELCRRCKPDLVLMDIKMPKLDGIQAAELLIKENIVQSIIMLTAYSGKEFDNKTLGVTNSPLPDTLDAIFGKGNILSKLMSFIGLFGLIASLHGIIIGYSRQIFAMSRSRYLPKFLSNVNSKGAPVAAIIIPSLIGMLFVLLNNTATIIVISSFGAIALHAISMVAFFLLRKKEPNMERPYKVSIALPIIAIVLNCIFLVTTIYSNISTISWVILAFAVAFIYYFVYSKLTASVSVEENQEKAI